MDMDERGKELGDFVCELADPSTEVTPKNVNDFIAKFEKIYIDQETNKCYRHSYALLSRRLFSEELFEDGVSLILRNIECVLDHLPKTKAGFTEETYEKFDGALHKLYDHISLEDVREGQLSARIAQIDIIENEQEALNAISTQNKEMYEKIRSSSIQLADNAASMTETGAKIAEQEVKLKGYGENLEKLQTAIQHHNIQSVSIIGLFASIILAFTGGYTMLTGVFANLATVHGIQLLPYIGMTFAVGLVLFNLVFAVFRFTSKMCFGKAGEPATDKIAKRAFWVVNIVCVAGMIAPWWRYLCAWPGLNG